MIGAVIYLVFFSGSANDMNVSAKATAGLAQAVSQLSRQGFGGSDNLASSGSASAADCAKHSAGEVKQFLVKNPCQDYEVASIKTHKQGITTEATVSWVGLATSALAAQYKKVADDTFTALCYASGQNGTAAWVAQVRTTGHVAFDREVLQAVSPVKLSAAYLAINCLK